MSANLSTLDKIFITTGNVIGNGGEYLTGCLGRLGIPMVCGAAGGWLSHATWRTGAVQGFLRGAVISYMVIPTARYVYNHSGDDVNDPTTFHPNAQKVLSAIGVAAAVALPIFLTKGVVNFPKEYLPTLIADFLKAGTDHYGIWSGIGIEIAPFIAQGVLEIIRHKNAEELARNMSKIHKR